jgi:hypothetical protein
VEDWAFRGSRRPAWVRPFAANFRRDSRQQPAPRLDAQQGVKFELENGIRRDKIKVLGNGVCAPVMRAVVGSLMGGSGGDLLEEDLRPRSRQKTAASRRHGKKATQH